MIFQTNFQFRQAGRDVFQTCLNKKTKKILKSKKNVKL